jgi:site-specific DNA-methyltransferase (adenine-specific)
MSKLGKESVDMILSDLPYGTTQCVWDSVIPFKDLWEQYERIIKPNGAIVLTASQPFTSNLVMSNIKLFRYSLVWEKSKSTGYFNSNPLTVFSYNSDSSPGTIDLTTFGTLTNDNIGLNDTFIVKYKN